MKRLLIVLFIFGCSSERVEPLTLDMPDHLKSIVRDFNERAKSYGMPTVHNVQLKDVMMYNEEWYGNHYSSARYENGRLEIEYIRDWPLEAWVNYNNDYNTDDEINYNFAEFCFYHYVGHFIYEYWTTAGASSVGLNDYSFMEYFSWQYCYASQTDREKFKENFFTNETPQ